MVFIPALPSAKGASEEGVVCLREYESWEPLWVGKDLQGRKGCGLGRWGGVGWSGVGGLACKAQPNESLLSRSGKLLSFVRE